jgi:hypothetical protein
VVRAPVPAWPLDAAAKKAFFQDIAEQVFGL